MKTRGERIRHVRETLGLSQEALGAKLGVAKAAVSGWETDKVDTLRSDNLIALERLSGFNSTWIETGRGAERVGISDASGTYNTGEGPPLSSVPLISWVQAGHWSEVVDSFRPGKGEKMVWTSKKISGKTFALRVKGDSMENPQGRPTYPAGSIIVVDPEREAVHGSAVVVRLESSKEATFKQLVIQEGGERYLKPLNPRYDTMKIDGEATICGVVVQTIMDED